MPPSTKPDPIAAPSASPAAAATETRSVRQPGPAARVAVLLLGLLLWSTGPGAPSLYADEPPPAADTGAEAESRPDPEALDALRETAAAGPAGAKFELAGLLLQLGGDEFEAEAVELLTEAAADFHLDSIFLLGVCHSDGLGVEADDEQAVAHYQRAANLGHAGAQLLLGIALQEGRGIAENPAEAIPWLQRSGNQGNPLAMLRLSEAYFEGLGVEANEAVGFEMAMRATVSDHPVALMNASRLFLAGKGTEVDIGRAIRLLERAGDAPWAKNNLAWLLATGPEPDHHDGDRAVTLAQEALDELTIELVWAVTDTLAAAEARRGRFDAAVAAQKQAIEQYLEWHDQQDEESLEAYGEEFAESKLPELEHRLAIYQDQQAVREDPQTGDSHPDEVRATARPGARDRGRERRRPPRQEPPQPTPDQAVPPDQETLPPPRMETEPDEPDEPAPDRGADPGPGSVPDKLRNLPKAPAEDDLPPGGRILI